ncbi:unnamed protein product [Tuber melanosporum]|uniref:(Perigord truffle) hypothetical protein n=1 Tax=Tuber melanosporum (strain Mel28) TaxID=656061 RepID=D5GM46_TUBMM|nr:uncharacterized protein GSTUM_00010522001 [Tuber melanosporum]CAZ85589.1 unnamed protein product [Tuber melanosporum]
MITSSLAEQETPPLSTSPPPPPTVETMSYPPPPGTSSSLPPRPPPPSIPQSTTPPAFSGFRPRQVAAPATAYAQQPQYNQPYSQQYPPAYQPPAQQYQAPTPSGAPHIVNPFPLPQQSFNRRADPRYADLDPELQAQIAQQQSIYDPSARASSNTTAAPVASKVEGSEFPAAPLNKPKNAPTVVRQGGGQTWTDSSLLEWDPSHFRLFVGNLAGEVTDDSLLKAFSKYPSVQKARVIRDKRTTKSKGYGFVAFSDGDEYFRAAREMNGKYIGSHPVLLKRSNTEIKPIVVGGKKGVKDGRVEKKKKKKKGGEQKNVLG